MSTEAETKGNCRNGALKMSGAAEKASMLVNKPASQVGPTLG
jgi:hypothetical protein